MGVSVGGYGACVIGYTAVDGMPSFFDIQADSHL